MRINLSRKYTVGVRCIKFQLKVCNHRTSFKYNTRYVFVVYTVQYTIAIKLCTQCNFQTKHRNRKTNLHLDIGEFDGSICEVMFLR